MYFRGDYYFLSNFYPVSIRTKNWGIWLSAEHLYQACKFKDASDREKVRNHPPKGLKRYCKGLESFGPDWNDKRLACMRKIVDLKFAQHAFLQRKLVAVTGVITEDNTWHDNYWGNCLCEHRDYCLDHEGDNNLGKILMEVRDLYVA